MLFSFTLVAFISLTCGQKRKQPSLLQIKISSLAGTTLPGGVYIWAENFDKKLSFAFHLPDENQEFVHPIPPGKWFFHAIGWTGPARFEGSTKCGNTEGITFISGDVPVDINLSSDCSGPIFGPADYLKLNQFTKLRVAFCNDLTSVTASGDACASNMGTVRSIKVFLPSYPITPFGQTPELAPNSLGTACITTGTVNYFSTNLLLPVGNGNAIGPAIVIKGYASDSTCSVSAKNFVFPLGLNSNYSYLKLFFHHTVTDNTDMNVLDI